MTRIWTFTTLLRVNTGPPTWWKPDIGAEWTGKILHVRVGWLRACVQIGIGVSRHRDEETKEAA